MPWRRKGGDKCRLLFEKPHALAPAWHVAGACVCEPRKSSLAPFVEMAEDAPAARARWISRILFTGYEEVSPRLLFRPLAR